MHTYHIFLSNQVINCVAIKCMLKMYHYSMISNPFGELPGRDIAELNRILFSIFKEFKYRFPKWILQSEDQYRRVCLSLKTHICCFCFQFTVKAILCGVRWNLSTVLVSISRMVNDAEHFFIHPLTVCNFSSEKCLQLVISFIHFLLSLLFSQI